MVLVVKVIVGRIENVMIVVVVVDVIVIEIATEIVTGAGTVLEDGTAVAAREIGIVGVDGGAARAEEETETGIGEGGVTVGKFTQCSLLGLVIQIIL